MGLLDVLNGMQNGPRGPSSPSAKDDGGGMSPMTMAILALLAWKAMKHFGGGQPGAAPAQAPSKLPGNVTAGRRSRPSDVVSAINWSSAFRPSAWRSLAGSVTTPRLLIVTVAFIPSV